MAQGSGGGPAGEFETSDEYALFKPYELFGEPNAYMVQQINEMFEILFKQTHRAKQDIDVVSNITASGDIFLGSVNLSYTDIQTSNTIPITVVSGVANRIVVPVGIWVWEHDIVSAYGANPSFSLQYRGVATNISGSLSTPAINGTTQRLMYGASTTLNTTVNTNWVGLDIVLISSADQTGGSSANKHRVSVPYMIVTPCNG